MSDALSMKALRIAAPYLSRFRDQILVIKVGGETVANPENLATICDQVAILKNVGIKVVLVHGGGNSLDEYCTANNLETQKVNGRRITSPEVLEAAIMVFKGNVQTKILQACFRSELAAVGVSGVDSGQIQATKRPPKTVNGETVDYGQVGDITEINPEFIKGLLQANLTPVVAPLAITKEGNVLNVNADTVAAKLAEALQALKLMFVVNVPGLCRDITKPETLVPYASWDQIEAFIQDGTISGGMLPKMDAAKVALDAGVSAVHIVDGRLSDGLLTELFTNEGSGTMIDKTS